MFQVWEYQLPVRNISWAPRSGPHVMSWWPQHPRPLGPPVRCVPLPVSLVSRFHHRMRMLLKKEHQKRFLGMFMTQNRETSKRNPVSDFECSALALESKQRWMWLLALRASSIGEVIAPAFKGGQNHQPQALLVERGWGMCAQRSWWKRMKSRKTHVRCLKNLNHWVIGLTSSNSSAYPTFLDLTWFFNVFNHLKTRLDLVTFHQLQVHGFPAPPHVSASCFSLAGPSTILRQPIIKGSDSGGRHDLPLAVLVAVPFEKGHPLVRRTWCQKSPQIPPVECTVHLGEDGFRHKLTDTTEYNPLVCC